MGDRGQQNSPDASVEICSVCAWRATCQKKFSISGKDIRCPDFVRDVSIKGEKEKEEEKEEKERK
ncbi:MAG: hypothetical protein OHK0032_14960 [Thermodesulfovibrionales bacterium]